MSRAAVLSGGAANGYLAAEMFAQCVERGAVYDKIYGVSSGAVFATIASRMPVRAALNAWDEKVRSFPDVFAPGPLNGKGIVDANPLRRVLSSLISFKPVITPYVVGVVDIDYGMDHYIDCSNRAPVMAVEAALASSAIPVFCTPIYNNGLLPDKDIKELVDGGTCQLTPFNTAIDDGHDVIDVFMCQPVSMALDKFQPANLLLVPGGPLIEYALRALDIVLHTRMLADILTPVPPGRKVTFFTPNRCPWSGLDFRSDTNKERVATATATVNSVLGPK